MDSSEEQSDGHDAFEGLRRELGEAFAEFPRSGEFFGGVELIEPLGEGAQGTVWRARVPSSGEIVAIKALQFFDRDGVASSAKAKQFVEDMRRARAVQNRNVVEVFGAGCEESWIWVTQELVEGGRTLHDEIIEQQRRSVPESDWHIRAAKFCYEVASGVAALHANGIVHRDIKPANVLISSNGTAKIADLGLIKRAARQPLESEETVVGTGAYLAPEVLMGGCKADVVTDVYSVGVLIYETCTLYRPIPGQSLLEIFRGQLRINPIAPHLISQTPEPLSRVCMRCIERWPSRRYREAKEVAAELARVIEGERLMTPRIAGARWCWRRIEERWLEVLALVLLFGVAVLALVLHGERSRVLDARRADELLAGEGELMIVPGCLEALRRSIAQGLTLRSERVRQLIEKEFVIGANGLITWGLMRRERAVEGMQVTQAWEDVQEALAEDERFDGLQIEPEADLVPLGEDPSGGLQAFWHTPTGLRPKRGESGEFVMEEETGIVLLLIPPGSFTRGLIDAPPIRTGLSPEDLQTLGWRDQLIFVTQGEGITADLFVRPFYLSKWEVSQSQWERIAGDKPSGYREGDQLPGLDMDASVTGLHPVEMVDYRSTVHFLGLFALQPPSETQWEYACRAGTSTRWPMTEDVEKVFELQLINCADVAYRELYPTWTRTASDFPFSDGYVIHAPVDGLKPNRWGLCGMLGNVYEWCADIFKADACQFLEGDEAFEGVELFGKRERSDFRAIRGGGWRSPVHEASTTSRWYKLELVRESDIGIRPSRQARFTRVDE